MPDRASRAEAPRGEFREIRVANADCGDVTPMSMQMVSSTVATRAKAKWISACLAVLVLFVAAPGSPAQAEYPDREIRLVIGFPPGSGADIVVRYLAEKLRLVSGATVIVENKPGASGNLAGTSVAKSRPDGYTVLTAGGSGLASSLSLLKKPTINPLTELELLGTIFKQPWTLVVDAKSSFESLPQLTKHLKEKGDKAAYGVATPTGIVMAEIYKAVAGLQTVQVNYRTTNEMLNDMLSGSLDMALFDPGFTLGQTSSGKIRPLAVSTAVRSMAFANVPTMAEGGIPGMDLHVWWVTAVPVGTPQPIKEKLRKWFDQILQMPETEKFFTGNGADLFISTPEEATAYLRQEADKWKEYVRQAKIEPQ